jgi:hypothetical protein
MTRGGSFQVWPGPRVAAAAVVGVGCALALPALWPYVAVAVGIAVAVELLSRGRGHSSGRAKERVRRALRSRRWLVVAASCIGVVALAVAAAVVILDGGGGRHPTSASAPAAEVPAAYAATVTLVDRTRRVETDEHVSLTRKDLAAAVGPFEYHRLAVRPAQAVGADPLTDLVPLPPAAATLIARAGIDRVGDLLRAANGTLALPAPQTRRLRKALRGWLGRLNDAIFVHALDRAFALQGWQLAHVTTGRREYRRRGYGPLHVSGALPARRLNTFHVLGADSDGDWEVGPASLRLDNGATVTVVAPHHAVGGVYPAPRRRQEHVADGTEEVGIALADARGMSVEFDVRSGPFRSAPLLWLLTVSLWSPVKWLIALLLVLASDTIREALRRVLGAAWRRLRPPRTKQRAGTRPRRAGT